jgi:hypothetical protein
MKKLMLVIFFIINMFPQYHHGSIRIEPVQQVYAQTGCPNNVADCQERTSFWQWLSNIFRSVGGHVVAFFTALTNLLEGGGGGGEGGSQTPNAAAIWSLLNTSSTAYGTPNAHNYGPGSIVTVLDPGWQISASTLTYSPDVPDCSGVLGGTAFLDNCGNCVGGTTGLFPCYVPSDCAGVLNGTAYLDSCQKCVGGTTGIASTCIKDCAGVWGGKADYDGCHDCAGGTTGIVRCDTVKPVKIICDTLAIKTGARLTNVLDSTALQSTDIQRLKDSALVSNNESGVSIAQNLVRNIPVYGVFNFQSGNGNNVNVATSDSIKKIIAGAHSHPKGTSNTPSPGDLYHLLEGNRSNNKYFADYIFAFDDSAQFAITLTDAVLANSFLTAHPRDSTIEGPPNNNWSTTIINAASNTTFFDDYMEIMRDMYNNQHYPISKIQAYANVRMFEKLNTGVKMFLKENGVFKQLSYDITIDANGKEHIKIKICQ